MARPLHPHFENGVVVVRIPKDTSEDERARAESDRSALAKRHSRITNPKCGNCGAKLKLSKKGNQYCGELCWLKEDVNV